MSDWSNAGLPPLQMRGYTGIFVPGIKRTPFRTAHPSQTIRERRQYNGIFETFLTHSQLVAAEAFIENVGYLAFTITTVTNENYLVRLMRSPEINSMSGETYRYVIHVDIPNALRRNFRYDWQVLESAQSSNFEYDWPVFNSVQSSNFEYRWNILVQSNNFEYNWQVFDTLVQSGNFEYNWQVDGGGASLPTVTSWLCWPSADNAPYGWGDPYENPPGTLVNPPLGTVQLSYSDTAHIARELDDNDIVTHGVNKIAASRDWRDDATPLVVSWDSGSVYSGGNAIVAATNILAACVRWESGVPYLLWLRENPGVVYAQECNIVNDEVVGVTGNITSMGITGNTTDAWWCEFSQNGLALTLNLGASVLVNESYYANIPWPFVGQAVNPVLAEGIKDPITNWVDYNNYEGTQRFLIKSQYVNNVLTHVWLEIHILRSKSITGGQDDPISGLANCTAFSCTWNLCGNTVYTFNSEHPSSAAHVIDKYEITPRVLIETTEIYSEPLQDTDLDQWLWTVNAADTTGSGNPDFPPSNIGPFPGWCPYPPRVTYTDVSTVYYRYLSRQSVDARFSTCVIVDFGQADPASSATRQTWLQVETHRESVSTSTVQVDGNFGYVTWPLYTQAVDDPELKSRLIEVAQTFCPADGLNMPTTNTYVAVTSICLSADRAAVCAFGLDEDLGSISYVDLVDGADIDTILSINNQTNQRLIIKDSNRYFGVLKQ